MVAPTYKVIKNPPAMKKKKKPVEPRIIDPSEPIPDVEADPGLAALMVAKALALLGDLPDCHCYDNKLVWVAREEEGFCQHVYALVEKSLLEDDNPEIRAEYRPSLPPDKPTQTEPGTPARHRILRQRIKKYLSCDHKHDRKHILAKPALEAERTSEDE